MGYPIQIQHLLKLNARKINLYDFHYTIKSIDTQGFQLFFTSDNRIFGDFIKRFNFQALEEFCLFLAGNFMVNKILLSKKQKATIIDSCFNFINHMVTHPGLEPGTC